MTLQETEQLRGLLNDAQAVLIGAGAGLSTSAGFVYTGERFRAHFADFEEKYGFHDMYSGGFYPYETEEEKWAYWSRYVYINRYEDPPKPVYEQLIRQHGKASDCIACRSCETHCPQKIEISAFMKTAAEALG